MKDNVKHFLRVILIAMMFLLLGAGLWLWSSSSQDSGEATSMTAGSDIVLFYGKECPHCQDLDKKIKENKIDEKVKFDSLEVWHNAENRKIFKDKAFEYAWVLSQVGITK
jgi:glutaredoxin-related protein